MVTILHAGILKPTGGSAGYLYNLQNSIKNNNIQDIVIINQENKNIFTRIKKVFLSRRKRKIALYKQTVNNKENLKILTKSEIIHFHTVPDMYFFSKVYDIKKHVVLLSHHAPELSEEYAARLYIESNGFNKQKNCSIKTQQRNMDIFAFKNADYLVYPCKGAIKPYINFFIKHNIDYLKKIKYVITSSEPFAPKISQNKYKDKFNIPHDKKIIAYVGRKEIIKGFDVFCNIAKELKDNNNFFFVSIGSGDIKAPNQSNFLDIGWSDDPDSFVNMADILIVPNRNTYFDLIIVQALSINKTIITTNTGGNNWFEDKNINLFFVAIDNINAFIEKLNDKAIYDKNTKNIDLYNKYLNNDIFAKNYHDLYDCISKDLNQNPRFRI